MYVCIHIHIPVCKHIHIPVCGCYRFKVGDKIKVSIDSEKRKFHARYILFICW